MTTKNDNLEKRLASDKWGPAREETIAVPKDGFVDPTGEFPKREHFYGSSINKFARGLEVDQISTAGDPNVDVEIAPKNPSQYPLNQVKETSSGHVIEVNDTPGAESLMVKHRTGAGIEMLSDGTIIVKSKGRKIELSGADHTVIVEGHGHMVYKGNLTMSVSGDYNLNVGGDLRTNVAGSIHQDVTGSQRAVIGKNYSTQVLGNKDERVVGHNSTITLKDETNAVKGDQYNVIEGSYELVSGEDIHVSAENALTMSALTGIITAGNMSVMGVKGTLGGQNIEHYGKVYSGPAEGMGTETTFYGTLVGKASEAVTAEFAQKADQSHSAFHANGATVASMAAQATGGGDGGTSAAAWTAYQGTGDQTTSSISLDPDYRMKHVFEAVDLETYMPTKEIIGGLLGLSDIGIKHAVVDTEYNDLKNKLIRSDDYADIFDRTPTIHEIRKAFKNSTHMNNSQLTSTLIAEGRLNPEYRSRSGMKVRRTTNKSSTPQFGYTPIGNNPMENRSKRFTVKK